MKIAKKVLRTPMSKDELKVYYEQVVGSHRVSRNKKKYHRPDQKKVG